jgi:enoyl-CoA hydratase/carnithine racemase
MSDPRVRLEVRGEVAEIVFSCPPVNALSHQFIDELNEAIDRIPPKTRAVAVTSDVERVFMAGADIAFMSGASLEEGGEYLRSVQRTFRRMERLDPPVVAGIDGACLGGGLEFALTCDIRIVSEPALLGLPEVTLGILAAAGGTQRLVRAIGQGVARDLLLTGRRISGVDAVAIGLASRLVPKGKAGEAARELAAELAAGAKEGIQATKRLALAASENSIEAGLNQEWSEWMQVRRSDNAQEGLTAFLEKRDPRFS